MSLAIAISTNSGIILAADSLETYKNAIGDTREATTFRTKIFQISSNCGVLACGLSFMNGKSLETYMKEFKKSITNLELLSTQQIANLIYDYFAPIYGQSLNTVAANKQKDLEDHNFKDIKVSINLEAITFTYKDTQGRETTTKFYQPILELLIVGLDKARTNQQIFKVTLPDPKENNGLSIKLNDEQFGAVWIGQTEILVRLIRGWAPNIKRFKTLAEMQSLKQKEFLKELDDQEYIINWGSMTLQDAVDFCRLAIQVTEHIQKITDGTWAFPGSSPGVGGPVDVAILTPEKGFTWLARKKLKIDSQEFDV